MENIYDFQVGDKVFDIMLEKNGIITEIVKSDDYPIKVKIHSKEPNNNEEESYTLLGEDLFNENRKRRSFS